MKSILMLLAVLIFSSCGKNETLRVIHNNDRVTDLERRMKLNEDLDLLRDQAIEVNRLAIISESESRIEGDQDLMDLIDAERDARILGDFQGAQALASAIFVQQGVNLLVQIQMASVNFKISQINSKISNLKSRVDNAEVKISTLEDKAITLAQELTDANTRITTEVANATLRFLDLQGEINLLKKESVKVYMCGNSDSTERILKINNKFYAVMNRITLEDIDVISGSTDQVVSSPKRCLGLLGQITLPVFGGCIFGQQEIPASSVTIPTHATKTVSVVSEVKIALEIIPQGTYNTTDGSSVCQFSIDAQGNASNLNQVQ